MSRLDEQTRRALGTLLRETREARSWRQHDMAEATGFSVRTIGTYEREGPPDRVIDTLDAALGGELRALATQADIALPPPRARHGMSQHGVRAQPSPMLVAVTPDSNGFDSPIAMTAVRAAPILSDPFTLPSAGTPHTEASTDERGSAALAEFLRREMAVSGVTSSHELGRALGIAQGTAHRLLTGNGIPREQTLARIARWARVPITEIRELAHRATGEATPFRIPREFDQLSSRERAALVELGWVMLAAHGDRVTR